MKAWRPSEALYTAVCESMPGDLSDNQRINRMAEHWLETQVVLQNVTEKEEIEVIPPALESSLSDIQAGVEAILDALQR